MGTRSSFGQVAKLPSGRFRARYRVGGVWHNAPVTFTRKADAQGWLHDERRLMESGSWTPPAARRAAASNLPRTETFGEYAAAWLEHRPLKPRTREHYSRMLDRFILPEFGPVAVGDITPAHVRAWHARTAKNTPVQRAHAYSLLRAIFTTATTDELVPSNPCRIARAGNASPKRTFQPLSVAEVRQLVEAMPERHQTMTLTAAFMGLRFGELTALRRRDVDLARGVLHVRRAVVRTREDGAEVTTTKSPASVRTLHMPPFIVEALREHLRQNPTAPDGLLFPGARGEFIAPASLYGRKPGDRTAKGWGYYAAREAVGRPDLHWHDLRHVAVYFLAKAGATLEEIRLFLGDSTLSAVLRYLQADDRNAAVYAQTIGDQWASAADAWTAPTSTHHQEARA